MKLLRFYAEWCTPCHQMLAKIATWDQCIHEILENVDVDTYAGKAMCQKYNVRSVPTLILVNDHDEEVKRWQSYNSNIKGEILELL